MVVVVVVIVVAVVSVMADFVFLPSDLAGGGVGGTCFSSALFGVDGFLDELVIVVAVVSSILRRLLGFSSDMVVEVDILVCFFLLMMFERRLAPVKKVLGVLVYFILKSNKRGLPGTFKRFLLQLHFLPVSSTTSLLDYSTRSTTPTRRESTITSTSSTLPVLLSSSFIAAGRVDYYQVPNNKIDYKLIMKPYNKY